MSPNKKSPSPVLDFRQAKVLATLPGNLQCNQYLIPMAVKSMGQLIGIEADARFIDWDADTHERELEDAYREVAVTTAILLDAYSVGNISDEAVHSVNHRLAAAVDPLVSLHARVDHLFRAYTQDEPETIKADVEKLWAALEFRCQAITGKTFSQLLAEV